MKNSDNTQIEPGSVEKTGNFPNGFEENENNEMPEITMRGVNHPTPDVGDPIKKTR